MTTNEHEALGTFIEIQDAAESAGNRLDLEAAPGAALMEVATILKRFEDQIDDEWRYRLIMTGAALFELAGLGKDDNHG